jgi:hypothetical protein
VSGGFAGCGGTASVLDGIGRRHGSRDDYASVARIYARLTGTVLPEELAITQR